MQKTEFNLEQFNLAYPDGIENQYWHIARSNIIFKNLKQRTNIKECRILEVGCGKGIVVQALRKKGLDCYGVELAEVPIIESVSSYIQAGVDANSLDLDFRNSIDVLMLLDVIEHIENPSTFLNTLKSYYPNVSYFIITVPASKELWSNYDEFYGHYRRYELPMVEEQAKNIQAKVSTAYYFFKFLYLPARITLGLGKKRSTKLNGPKSTISKLIHKLIANISFLLDATLPKSWKGTSIIMVLKIGK